MIRLWGLLLLVLCQALAAPIHTMPNDVKALVKASTQKWHRYHALPSLRMDAQKAETPEVIDANTMDCRKIIGHFEKKYGIPQHLMLAIARVESRCRPWAVHHNGSSLQFRHAKTALEFLKTASGNIQVGCMQLDCRSHQDKFGSVERMMTPYYNIKFAAQLLRRLHKRYGSWERAVSFYHAASPDAQRAYCRRIVRQLKILKGDASSFTKGGDAWI